MITPWGKSDGHTVLEDGVHDISTPSHGGLMVSRSWAQHNLTPEARAEGEPFGNFLCYEEDCDWCIPVFENPRLAILMSGHTCRQSVQEIIDHARQTLECWHPIYCIKRDLAYNHERAKEYISSTWYSRRAELAKLMEMTA